MKSNIQKLKELVNDNVLPNVRVIIINLDNSDESFTVLEKFIHAYNEVTSEDNDSKIGNLMDNSSIIEVMSKYKNFNARIISELYKSSSDKTTYFLYNDDIMTNDIELLDVSTIGEIKSTILDHLSMMVWEVLKSPENPKFTPIYKMIFESFI